MTAQIIDGKLIAADVKDTVMAAAAHLTTQHGVKPGLAVVLVGTDPASEVYVRSKGVMAEKLGFASFTHKLPAETPEADLLALVRALNADPAVHGILVQMPLPKQIDPTKVIDTIDPAKDVDGLTNVSAGRLVSGQIGFQSCTPKGCMILLRRTLGTLAGKHAIVLGRSILVGKPVGLLLLNADCTVTMAHSKTKNLADLCRTADILVAAVGRPEMVRGDWIKPGATVIDVGINRIAQDGGKDKLIGDVCFDEAVKVAGAITPVPGGVGPMTIACLMQNTIEAACRIHNLPLPEGIA
jgi:methylenetetrahydrofolate dehydrogenase (NADP+) / methenyltetrahydrofolate cyclohydrolase